MGAFSYSQFILDCDSDIPYTKPMRDKRIAIKAGWFEEGKLGIAVGDPVLVDGMLWVPVVWDSEDDPDWHKLSGLDFI